MAKKIHFVCTKKKKRFINFKKAIFLTEKRQEIVRQMLFSFYIYKSILFQIIIPQPRQAQNNQSHTKSYIYKNPYLWKLCTKPTLVLAILMNLVGIFYLFLSGWLLLDTLFWNKKHVLNLYCILILLNFRYQNNGLYLIQKSHQGTIWSLEIWPGTSWFWSQNTCQ